MNIIKQKQMKMKISKLSSHNVSLINNNNYNYDSNNRIYQSLIEKHLLVLL